MKTLEQIAEAARELEPADPHRQATVILRPGQTPEAVDTVATVLREYLETQGIYARGPRLVRMAYLTVDGFKGPDGLPVPVRTLAMLQIAQTNLALAIGRLIEFKHPKRIANKKSGKTRRITARGDCPPKIARALLEGPEHWEGWARIERVAQTPLLLLDHDEPRLITRPGRTGSTFLDVSPEVAAMSLPETLDKEAAQEALGRLLLWLDEFPFVTELDRTVAVAAMLTAAMRVSVVQAPAFFITKPSYGAGATTLAKLCSILATGTEPPVVASSRNEQESRKQLETLLINGAPVIVLDNLQEGAELSNAVLGQALTENLISIRELGRHIGHTCDTRRLFLATAVNGTIAADLLRRVLRIRIDPKMEHPEGRRFRRPRLLQDIVTHRAAILRDCYTITSSYWRSHDLVETMPLTSLDEWVRAVAEPLVWLGRSDVVTSTREASAHDPNNERLKALIPALALLMRIERRRGYSVARLIEPHGTGDDLVGELYVTIHRVLAEATQTQRQYQGRSEVNPMAAGRWLRTVEGRVVETRALEVTADSLYKTEGAPLKARIRDVGTYDGSKLWAVETLE